jgi:hypothetical protein
VAVGDAIADREQQVEVADHVRALRLHRVPARDHRIRRRWLLAVVHDRVGQHLGHDAVEELALFDVADEGVDLAAGDLMPRVDAVGEARDRGQGVGSVLVMPPAAGEVVDDEDVVPTGRESHRRGPPQVAIAAEDQDSHGGAR